MEDCQEQKRRNARHYERTATYLFTNKIKCYKCGNFLGGHATTKKNGKTYYYYKCDKCKDYYNEQELEKSLKEILVNIMEEQYLLEEYYAPFLKAKLDDKTEEYKN